VLLREGSEPIGGGGSGGGGVVLGLGARGPLGFERRLGVLQRALDRLLGVL
jgi:hypothetical protein